VRLRVLIYLLLIVYSVISAVLLQQLYSTGVDPASLPILGFFLVPRDVLPVAISAAIILIPWGILNLYGLFTEASWLMPSRHWGVIIMFMFVVCLYLPMNINPVELVVFDPALAYCMLEAYVIIVVENK
jgi:hypothetical protein